MDGDTNMNHGKKKKRYHTAATGGTFDIIHRGHCRLFDAAFDVAGRVIIGLTSDKMLASHRTAAKPVRNRYDVRLENLNEHLKVRYPGLPYIIRMLDDEFGPAVIAADVEVLVASAETAHKASALNAMRKSAGLKPVDVIAIPMEMACDDVRISSSRIRNMEIDSDGNVIGADSQQS